MNTAALRGCALAGLTVWVLAAYASEFGGSNYIPGFYGDFYMASLGEPGVYLNNLLGYYHAAENDKSSETVMNLPGIIGVTDYRVLGGRYVAAIFPAVVYGNYRTESPKNFSQRVGIGDMYIVPFGLNWEGEGWYVLAFEGISAPTATFGEQRDVNLGRNYWSFDSNLSVTKLFDDGTYEVSFNVGVMANTQNTATDFHTGTEFHLDYLLGYHFPSSLGLGISGTYYTQTDSDNGAGVTLPSLDGASASLGPAAMYTFQVNKRDVTVSIKWLHELSANNHTQGDYLLVRTILAF